MAYRITWSPEALESAELLLEFILINWGKESSDRLVKSINATLQLIAIYPEMYPVLSPDSRKIRKCVIQNKTLLLYRLIGENEIEIVLLIDARQNILNFPL